MWAPRGGEKLSNQFECNLMIMKRLARHFTITGPDYVELCCSLVSRSTKPLEEGRAIPFFFVHAYKSLTKPFTIDSIAKHLLLEQSLNPRTLRFGARRSWLSKYSELLVKSGPIKWVSRYPGKPITIDGVTRGGKGKSQSFTERHIYDKLVVDLTARHCPASSVQCSD